MFVKKFSLILLLIFPYFVFSQNLTFNEIYPIQADAGSTVVHLVPITLNSTNDQLVNIEINSQYGWKAQGPEKITLSSNSLNYLTFTVDIPLSAKAGTVHLLEIKFLKDSDNSIIGQIKLASTVKAKTNLSLTTINNTQNTNESIQIEITNTSNYDGIFELEVDNLSSNFASIRLYPTRISLKSNETKLVEAKVTTVEERSRLIRFKIVATSQETLFKSKIIQLREFSTDDVGMEENSLTHSMSISNRTIHINSLDETQNQTTERYDIDGNLSDYVAIAAHIQMTQWTNEENLDDFRIEFKGEGFKIIGGDDYFYDERSLLAPFLYRGINSEIEIKDLTIGSVMGTNKDDDEHFNLNTLMYSPNENHRFFVGHLIDGRGESVAGSYRGQLISNDSKIDFAPIASFVRSDDPTSESNHIGAFIKSSMIKKAPSTLSINYYDEYEAASFRAIFSTFSSYKDIHWSASLGHETRNQNNIDEIRHLYWSRAQMSFPIIKELTGSLHASASKEFVYNDYATELGGTLLYSHKRFQLALGQAYATNGSSDVDETWHNTTLRSNIKINDNISLRTSLIYKNELSSTDYQFYSDIGPLLKYPGPIPFEAQIGHSYRSSINDEVQNTDHGITARARAQLPHNLDLTLAGRYSFTDQSTSEISINITKTGITKTPEFIERSFGGVKTGGIDISVCIDKNKNAQCDPQETQVDSFSITVGDKKFNTSTSHILIRGLDPTDQKVQAVENSLPMHLKWLTKEWNVSVSENKTRSLKIPVEENYYIRLFGHIDTNRNELYESSEAILKTQVYKIVDENGNSKIVKTNEKSKLLVEGLTSGSYEITPLYNEKRFELMTNPTITIQIPQDNAKNFSFPYLRVEVKRKELVGSFFPSSISNTRRATTLLLNTRIKVIKHVSIYSNTLKAPIAEFNYTEKNLTSIEEELLIPLSINKSTIDLELRVTFSNNTTETLTKRIRLR